jgi:hypothetical protein
MWYFCFIMSIESGAKFNNEGQAGGSPSPESIQPEDCTLALIAGDKAGCEMPELEDRITDQSADSTSYDCRACFAKLVDSGFANVVGSMSCGSLFRKEAERIISEN